jgi:hypothetical protein
MTRNGGMITGFFFAIHYWPINPLFWIELGFGTKWTTSASSNLHIWWHPPQPLSCGEVIECKVLRLA